MYNSDFLNSISKDLTIFMVGEKIISNNKTYPKEYFIVNKFDTDINKYRNIFICIQVKDVFTKCNILLQDKNDNSRILVMKNSIPNLII